MRTGIWIIGVVSGALLAGAFAWLQLWVEPHIDDGTLTGWRRVVLHASYHPLL